ncbi:ATP-binding cassette domain-containing protein [Aquibium sp. A9E412]|uniref:ABC transporter ATP-binding protein n=1 Tax=Aquibium sp. A9E412 TaxID=2976767 RepID=UPI0025B27F35|nr:oligopeptide/dipeptide ABC transporter ATP-binding protein [Aquibium sp. A9E412]MDN2565074.1 ATP-binding cassette domain-containing protein [Aquibium sp. A9E412]
MTTTRNAMPQAGDEGIVVDGLKVQFPIRSGVFRRQTGIVRAVDGVSFDIPAGTTVGLVGESGSGKTTTGRALLGLAPVSGGGVRIFGESQAELAARPGALPRTCQLVFQDPFASLNPRMTVGAALSEVLAVHGLAGREERARRVQTLLDGVGLRPEMADRHPVELSGGQRQRVAIARALAVEPRFIVLDEVVSALDVSIQGQILNLLIDLQRERGLTYLFITHDLGVVRYVSQRIVVMYGGKVMETAPRDRLFSVPHHPYTHALLSAVPLPDPKAERARARLDVRSEPPDPAAPPPGCRFQRSCPFATDLCRSEEPPLRPVAADHLAACHHMERPEVRQALTTATQGVSA